MSSHHSHNLGNSQTPAESFSFLSTAPFLQFGNYMQNHPSFCHGTILVLRKHLQNHSAFCHSTILATWEPHVESSIFLSWHHSSTWETPAESFSFLSRHHSCNLGTTCGIIQLPVIDIAPFLLLRKYVWKFSFLLRHCSCTLETAFCQGTILATPRNICRIIQFPIMVTIHSHYLENTCRIIQLSVTTTKNDFS